MESAELDCGQPQSRADPTLGGLVYCTTDGTGRFLQPGPTPVAPAPFPECCDPDNDGLGTLKPSVPDPRLVLGTT